ncbi:hypothetical protein BASA62_003275 [Batrachochytrium salamandrivorans]|nr:hypothetical protein BASA62_003275 [Batrachochytrium salamandrivorans]
MKFNVLVVAAMVIASVNAGGADELPSGAENSGEIPQYLSLKKDPICEGLETQIRRFMGTGPEILRLGFMISCRDYLNLMKG